MSTKKQSFLKDKETGHTENAAPQKDAVFADNFFSQGDFIHHSFVVEEEFSPVELVRQLEELPHSPNFLAPFVQTKDIFTIDMARELSIMASKSYSKNAHLLICTNALTYTREAQNALLNILEEPHPSTTLIVMVRDVNMLLDTILSRCVTVRSAYDIQKKLSNEPLSELSVISKYAQKITNAHPAERISLCEELIKKNDDESLSRNDIAGIIIQIESNIHAGMIKKPTEKKYHANNTMLKDISQLRNLLTLPSASAKQVLEGVVIIMNLSE